MFFPAQRLNGSKTEVNIKLFFPAGEKPAAALRSDPGKSLPGLVQDLFPVRDKEHPLKLYRIKSCKVRLAHPVAATTSPWSGPPPAPAPGNRGLRSARQKAGAASPVPEDPTTLPGSAAVSARRPHTASGSPHPPHRNDRQRVHQKSGQTGHNPPAPDSGSSGNSIPRHRSGLPSTGWKSRYRSPCHRHAQRYRPWGGTTGSGLYKTGSPRLPQPAFKVIDGRGSVTDR